MINIYSGKSINMYCGDICNLSDLIYINKCICIHCVLLNRELQWSEVAFLISR